jgi:NADH:ubiquinone reductase (non-electrogenic)
LYYLGFRFIKDIDLEKYNVFVVTPRNHFLFTPLLPGSAAGTVEFRSIIEPVRRAHIHPDYHFFEAQCDHIDTENKTIDCLPTHNEDPHFTLKYDKLIVVRNIIASSNLYI